MKRVLDDEILMHRDEAIALINGIPEVVEAFCESFSNAFGFISEPLDSGSESERSISIAVTTSQKDYDSVEDLDA